MNWNESTQQYSVTKYTYGRYSQYKYIHLPLPWREKNLTSTCKNCVTYQEVLCTVFHLTQNLQILILKVLHKFSSILQHHHLPTCIKEPDLICTILCMKRTDCVLRAVTEVYYIDDNHYLNVMQYTEVHIPTAVTTILKKYNLLHTL